MKRMGRTIGWFGFFAWLAAGVAVPAQVIKLGTVAPEGSPWHDALLEIGQEWKEVSNGRVKMQIYPGGVAGDEPDMLRKMRIGQLHAAALTTMGLITVAPDIEAITFPMLVRTDEEMDVVVDAVGDTIEAQLEAKGFKVLTWSMAGWVRFFAKEPTVTVDELRERKLFFWGSDAEYFSLIKSLGFKPVSLAVTDLLPSLQTGLVDAFAAPPAAALSFQWFGLAPHMSTMRWQALPNLTVISLRQWDRIPADLQPVLERIAREVGERLQVKSRELELEAIEAMTDHGLAVHRAPPEVEHNFRELVEEYGAPRFVGRRFSTEIYQTIQRVLEAHRERP